MGRLGSVWRLWRAIRGLALLPRQVAAHEIYIQDLHARLARLESPDHATPESGALGAIPVAPEDAPPLQTPYGPVPLPPASLRLRVNGASDAESFVRIGQRTANDIEAALATIGREAASFHKVLDFGCGCGRTLIPLAPRWQHAHFWGTDIDAEAIGWCQGNLPFATFTVNDALPPVQFERDAFDLVYAISVFTHLNEAFQSQWLAELQRITTRDGIALITLHGAYYTDQPSPLPPELLAKLSETGHVFVASADVNSPFPDWYQTSFHTQQYVIEEFSKYFKVLGYIPRGVNNHQDVVLLTKA